MFSFIEGKLISKMEGTAVVECNGIGFELGVSNNTLVQLPEVSEIVRVHTHLQMREDGIALFGFASLEEKNMFSKLITVSGVGPKSAMAILSSMALIDLVDCLVNENVGMLSKAKGIGKKTAERLVLELKDKLDLFETFISSKTDVPSSISLESKEILDAIELLVSLGVSRFQAGDIVKKVAKEGDTVEEIISNAFRIMNR